eukprot:513913_1
MDENAFWRQIGFNLTDSLLSIIKHRALTEDTKYIYNGKCKTVLHRLVEELHCINKPLINKYNEMNVTCLLHALKMRPHKIIDKDAFYARLGFKWDDELISVIKQHSYTSLLENTKYIDAGNVKTILHRLVVELQIKDRELLILNAFHYSNSDSDIDGYQKQYPIYINKTLFHISDDENVEVLVDEAVLKLLSFDELWQDADGFVRSLYNDHEFSAAVQRTYETLQVAYAKKTYGFFEEFVLKQYSNEIEEYKLQTSPFYDENINPKALREMSDDNEKHDDVDDIEIHEYIKQWKRLYLLETNEQQMFFWSHIITVCAVIKYTQIEFENQLIAFGFESANTYSFPRVDFIHHDAQREITDMISWEGFLIPPDLTSDDTIHKRCYTTILGQSKIKPQLMYCGHNVEPFWKTATGYTYCDSCAKLLHFAEFIRKFVLEYENDELLWPWYRNSHHVGSIEKYRKYINKYNLTHLYIAYDLLHTFTNSPDDGIVDNQNKGKTFHRTEEDDERFSREVQNKKSVQISHIRHRRKFAGKVLLGGWDILRNLNIIRQQLLPIMNIFTSEILCEGTFTEKDYLKDRTNWWIEEIGHMNVTLREHIEKSDWETLFNFEHLDTLEIHPQNATVFNEFLRAFLKDDRESEEYFREFLSGCDEYFRVFLSGISCKPRWWGFEHDALLLELALRFDYSSEEFVKELTATKKEYYQFMLKMHQTAKFKKIQIFAGRDLGFDASVADLKMEAEQDDEKDGGYQQFKAWCKINENIMHRLKYITFLIVQKLSQCSPSIIDLRIPNKDDQPTFE